MYMSLIIPVATGRVGAGYGTADDVSVDGVSVNESGSKVYSLSYQYDLRLIHTCLLVSRKHQMMLSGIQQVQLVLKAQQLLRSLV